MSDRREESEDRLAGMADCINLELRENGTLDVPQITAWLDDMRPYVRLLVDYVRARALRTQAQEIERLRAVVEAAERLDNQARHNKVRGHYVVPEPEYDAVLAALQRVQERQG